MMKWNNFGLKWRDAINSIIIMLIGNLLMIVMNATDGEFPTLNALWVGFVNSVKYAVIPYLLKNFFTDDIRYAQKTLSNAKVEGIQAAEPIPPPIATADNSPTSFSNPAAPNDAEEQNKK